MTKDMQQVTINGLKLDVEYTYEQVKDVFGTGDSPTQHFVEIQRVELTGSREDIAPLLSEDILLEIDRKIISIESGTTFNE